MSRPQAIVLESLAELREHAAAWDELWRHSDVAAPSARAELVAQWVEHYAPRARFRAVVVEQDGRLVAALPLVSGRRAKVISVGQLPSNEWSPCGDLIVDPLADVPRALDALVQTCQRLGWAVIWFDAVAIDAPRWQQITGALDRAGQPWSGHRRDEFEIGVVDLTRDWATVQADWSGNHRRHLRKADRRAESEGGIELRVVREFGPGELESLLRRGFEVEDQSWKGAASNSSVLRKPGLWDFFRRQAEQLAEWGQLALVFLEHRGKPIAFEYGWSSKGVYFSPKVGYDDAYAHLSPGQLLRMKLMERFCQDQDHKSWDFFGPLSDATAKWTTGSYSIGRLVVGASPVAGRVIMSGYKSLRPLVRRLRGQAPHSEHEQAPVADPLPTPDQAILLPAT